MITLVIFSMDRALQLDSLLRSIADHVTGVDRIKVIVHASSARHLKAYTKLAQEHLHADLLLESPEVGCSMRLAHALTTANHVGLAVDDMLFYRASDYCWAAKELDAERAFTWSWRLGQHSPAQIVTTCDGAFWACHAGTDDRDYSYMFHTDGSLYSRAELVALLTRAMPDWYTSNYIPNAIESAAAREVKRMRVGLHLGPLRQTCITWQLNKEPTTKNKYGAPWCEIPETNLAAMAEAYLAGKRVDNSALYADLAWTHRFNLPGARSTHVHACEEASRFYASLIR